MFKKPFDITVFFYVAVALLMAAVVGAVALAQLWLLAMPVVLLGALVLLQRPVVLLYLLLASIPWSVEYLFGGGFGTDLPDEPLMLLASLAAILLLLYQRDRVSKKLLHPILWLLLVQVVWMIITAATSTHPLISIKYGLAKGWYLLSFVALPLLVLQQKQQWKTAAVVLVFSMLGVVIVSMVRHASYGFTFADINRSLYPFFRNHVNYSALLVCMVPLLVTFLYFSRKGAKGILSILLLITLVALYLSYARGAWLALVVGAAAFVLLRIKMLWQAYVLALVLVIAAVFWLQHNNRYLQYAHDFNTTVFHTNFKEHLVATYKLKDVSTAERFYRWVAGVRMADERWQTGFGPNTFYHNYRPYTITAFKTWVSNNPERSTVHNYYLLTLIEQGIIGFLLFAFLVGFAFYTAQKAYSVAADRFWKTGVACAAVILSMICTVNFLSDLIETDKAGSVFYLCLSFLIMADRQTRGAKGN